MTQPDPSQAGGPAACNRVSGVGSPEPAPDAIAQSAPVRLSGVVVDYGQIELYRAAFMPLAMPENSSIQPVFGTFNRLIGPQAHSSDAVRAMYNSLIEHIR